MKSMAPWLLPLFLASAPWPGGAIVAPNDTGRAYEQAVKSLNKGNFDDAIVQFKDILTTAPHHLAARMSLAEAYLKEKNGPSAEKELLTARLDGGDADAIALMLGQAFLFQQKFQQVLAELKPGVRDAQSEAQVSLLRGQAYMGLNDTERAEPLLIAAFNALPGEPDPALALAKLALLRKDFEAARKYSDRSLATPRPSAEAFALRGDIARGQKKLGEAQQSFTLATEADPKMLAGWMGRAVVEVELGQDEAALKDLDKSLELARSNPVAYVLKATVYGRTNRQAEATQALRDAVDAMKRVPDRELENNPQLSLMSGIANFSLGNFPSAEAALNRYVTLMPGDVAGRRLLGATLLANNNPLRAEEVLRPMAVNSNKDAAFWSILGAVYARLNQYDDSIAAYRRSVELEPTSLENRNRLGATLMSKGANDEAITVLTDARAKNPDALQPGILMTMANLNKGNFKAAAETSKGLALKAPKNAYVVHLAGAAAMAGGDDATARRYFEQVLQIDPKYLQAYLNLARLDAKAGNLDAAVGHYQEVLRLNSNNLSALVELGGIAESRKQYDQALAWYDKAKASHPDIASVWYLVAHGYYAMGKYDAALAVAEQYAGEHPDEYKMQAVIATIQMAAKRPQDAINTMASAIDTAPDRALALLTMANMQITAGDLVGARTTLLKSISYDATKPEAQLGLVRLETQARNYKEALRLAQEMRKNVPNSALPDLATGDVLMAALQPEAALSAYTAAFTRQKSAEAVFGLYRARVALGQQDQGLDQLRKWTESHPDDRTIAVLYGDALMQQKLWKEAAAYYRAQLKIAPNNAGFLNNLAWALFSLNDKQARGFAEQALKVEPNNPSVMDTSAWIFIHNNELQRGLELLRQASAKSSNDPQILYHLGFALNAMGRRDEALEPLRKASSAARPFDGFADAKQLYEKLMSK